MSVHYSWENWLKAIKTNDIESVKNGLFYLDDQVHKPYALLEGGLDSLMLAAKLGHKQIVKILLDDCLQRVKSLKEHECDVDGICSNGNDESWSSVLDENTGQLDNFGNAMLTACKYGQFDIVEMLFTYKDQFDGDFVSQYSEQLMQNSTSSGNFKLVSFLIDKFRNNEGKPAMSAIIDALIGTILKHGHQNLSDLEEHVRNDPLYMSRLGKIHPLHRAIHSSDLKLLKQLLDKYKDWTNIKYPDKDDKWCTSMNVFDLTAAIGNTDCFEYLYIAASKVETCNVKLLLEGACNIACQQGRKDVIELILEKGWLQMSSIQDWSLMLKHSLWTDQVDVANFILDQFPSKINDEQKMSILKSINKDSGKFMQTPMENWSNRPEILQKLTRAPGPIVHSRNNKWRKKKGKNSRNKFPNTFKIPDLVFEGLMTAILHGSPESVKMYFGMIPQSEVKIFMNSIFRTKMIRRNHHQPIAELWQIDLTDRDDGIIGEVDNRKSIVVAEMLRPFVNDWDFFLESFDEFEDWPTLIAFLLHDPGCARRLDIKELMEKMTFYMFDSSDSSDGHSRCIKPFDYFDVAPIQEYVFTFDNSVHARKLANICKLFTVVCGSKLKSVLWDGLFTEMLNLNQECRDKLSEFIINSGIIVKDTEFLSSQESVEEEGYECLKELTRFHSIPDKIGLQALCRIAIRRTVRQTSLEVESLTDRMLKLEVEGLLPKPLVSYLLFRPELKELPCINIDVVVFDDDTENCSNDNEFSSYVGKSGFYAAMAEVMMQTDESNDESNDDDDDDGLW